MTSALAMAGNVAETSLAHFFHSASSRRNGRTTDPFRWTGRRGGSVETGRALRRLVGAHIPPVLAAAARLLIFGAVRIDPGKGTPAVPTWWR